MARSKATPKGKATSKSLPSSQSMTKKDRKPRKYKPTNFRYYINKVLKQVHPDLTISKHGITIVNDFIIDVFQRIASEASDLVKMNKGQTTMISRNIQTATRLLLHGELSKHAVSVGIKAVEKYLASK